uniref:Uncharacterized protein n=1 Tax=Solanum tuberosum TaxID=4113 RepID=M1DK15_SOLTU
MTPCFNFKPNPNLLPSSRPPHLLRPNRLRSHQASTGSYKREQPTITKIPKSTPPISLDLHNAANPELLRDCEQLETIRPPNRPHSSLAPPVTTKTQIQQNPKSTPNSDDIVNNQKSCQFFYLNGKSKRSWKKEKGKEDDKKGRKLLWQREIKLERDS